VASKVVYGPKRSVTFKSHLSVAPFSGLFKVEGKNTFEKLLLYINGLKDGEQSMSDREAVIGQLRAKRFSAFLRWVSISRATPVGESY
jgi:hypothetical protein